MPIIIDYDSYITKIKSFYFQYNALPTFDEALDLIGVSSKSSITSLFHEMLKRGLVSKEGSRYIPTDLMGALPLVGSVQAGNPSYEETQSEALNISSFLIERPESTFLVSVRGDSMEGAGLLDGDIVAVDRSIKYPKEGDIVIASVDSDSDFTVKYFYTINNKPILKPHNPNYDIIVPKQSIVIHGKVIGSLRKY